MMSALVLEKIGGLTFLMPSFLVVVGVPHTYAQGHYGVPGTFISPVKFTEFSSQLLADGTMADGDGLKLVVT
jgi:hypothetical protein